jgi:glycosyltransferase involved in cell wall biosynthesis
MFHRWPLLPVFLQRSSVGAAANWRISHTIAHYFNNFFFNGPEALRMQIGMIPFGDDSNPYQELTRRALVATGLSVRTFPKSNLLPLWRAAHSGARILHSDWPHSYYLGASALKSAVKRTLFQWQLRHIDHVKLVWTVHNLKIHNSKSRFDSEIEHFIRRADALVSLSKLGIQVIRDRWPAAKDKPIISIPHGHYCDWYRTDIPMAEARQHLGIPVKARVGALVGRLQPYKGIDELIPSFQTVSSSEDWLVIAGAPINRQYEIQLNELTGNHPRIRLIPRMISPRELETVLGAADYGVFPFREIFNSGSVILALSFGLPVVAPNLGAISEVVPDYAWFDAGDGSAEQLQRALNAAMRSNTLHKQGVRAKAHIREAHAWDMVGQRLKSLYTSL